jgi:hypothetical protein
MGTMENIFEFLDNHRIIPEYSKNHVNKNYNPVFNNYIVLKKIVQIINKTYKFSRYIYSGRNIY